MYCENCGKKLIRGYQFCMECGTPVPPEEPEQEGQPEAEAAAQQPVDEMPGIQPPANDEGTLVFCPTCGMRMQKSTAFCEKCGMRLADNGSSGSSVPLVNTDPLGGDFSGISDSDIAQIDSFVNNSGYTGGGITYGNGLDFQDPSQGLGGGNLNSEIEALNRQFANLNSTASDMPAISAPVHQPEPEPEPAPVPAAPEPEPFSRRVEDFSMEAGMPETQFLSETGLPVINGGEMAEPDIPVELEHHLDDINIDIPQPAVTEPEPAAPVYSEPEPAEPVYSEPEPAAPVYSEPEPVEPVYSEPEPVEPVYSEPEPVEPVYSEPEPAAPVYSEPEPVEPVYSEPEPVEPVYSEPEPAEPVYSEPEPVESVYSEPEPAEPVYSEPEPAAPVYSEPEPVAPVYSEPEPAEPVYSEPEPAAPDYSAAADNASPYTPYTSADDQYSGANVDTGSEDTVLFNTDPMPAPAPEPAPAPSYSDPAPSYSAPQPAAEPSNVSEDGVDLGKLVYCRNCGQDMYEKEAVCKNCGSPNKWNQKPMKHPVSSGAHKEKKEAKKVFGIFPIPSVVGAGVIAAGIIALVIFSGNAKKNDADMIQDSKPSTPNASTTAPENPAEVTDTPDDLSGTDPVAGVPVTQEADASVPEDTSRGEQEQSEPVVSEEQDNSGAQESAESSKPEEVKGDKDASKSEDKPAVTSSSPKPVTTSSSPKPVTTSSSPKPATTSSSPKPATTTTTKATTTTAKPVAAKPSSTVTSEDKQRAKLLDAFEGISAEVGKLHLFAQAQAYAMGEDLSRTLYTSGMTSSLASGKSSVATLYKNAEPSSAQFFDDYTTLEKLYNLYTDYYTYVTTSNDKGDKYSSTETSKWDSFNTTVKNSFNYKALQTSNQTDDDISRTYGEIMTDAVSAVSNAVSQYASVQKAVEKLTNSTFDSKVMAAIFSDNTSSIMKAAGYTQVAMNYYGILSSGVPSGYSGAKSSLSTASSGLESMFDLFIEAAYNDLSGFKSSCNSESAGVTKAMNSIKNSL